MTRDRRPRLEMPGLTDEESHYLHGMARKYIGLANLSRGVWDADDVLQSAYAGVLAARAAYEAKKAGQYPNYLYIHIRRELVRLAHSHRPISGQQCRNDRWRVRAHPLTEADEAGLAARPGSGGGAAEKLAEACSGLSEHHRAVIGHRYGVMGYARVFWGRARDPAMSRLNSRACYWVKKLKALHSTEAG